MKHNEIFTFTKTATIELITKQTYLFYLKYLLNQALDWIVALRLRLCLQPFGKLGMCRAIQAMAQYNVRGIYARKENKCKETS